MVRMPQPRPLLKPEPQRPKLANALMLLAAAPYALSLALVAIGGSAAVIYACVRMTLEGR
jgi:hypothetical protein